MKLLVSFILLFSYSEISFASCLFLNLSSLRLYLSISVIMLLLDWDKSLIVGNAAINLSSLIIILTFFKLLSDIEDEVIKEVSTVFFLKNSNLVVIDLFDLC